MTKAIRLILLGAILASFLIFPERPARAQGVQCSNYAFPSPGAGWSVVTGTSGSDTVQSVVTTIPGSAGTTGAAMHIFLSLPSDFYLYSVGFTIFTTIGNDWTTGYVGAKETGVSGYVGSGNIIQAAFYQWEQRTVYFQSPVADTIEILLKNPSTPTGFTVITIGSVSICGGPAVTLTPTPTDTSTPTNTPIFTPTFTLTPSPTNTPTPSLTPTDTDTPTPGPSPTASDTPVVTNTPVATNTSVATSTAIGIHTGGKLFATVPPPQQCSDAFNPCGEIPYPVPGFPTISLPSPTPPPVTALGPTGTLMGTPTAYGTTTGTPIAPSATITGTFNAGQGQVAAYATSGVYAVNNVAATPNLFEPGGPLATLPDTANQVGSYVGDFFGIVKAVQGFFLGKTGTIIAFLLIILLYIFLVRLFLFALPIIMKVFDLLLQIIQAIIP